MTGLAPRGGQAMTGLAPQGEQTMIGLAPFRAGRR